MFSSEIWKTIFALSPVLTNTPGTQTLSFWSCPPVVEKHTMLSKDENWISYRRKLNEKFDEQNGQSRSDSQGKNNQTV